MPLFLQARAGLHADCNIRANREQWIVVASV
jgi:hypothetical protein